MPLTNIFKCGKSVIKYPVLIFYLYRHFKVEKKKTLLQADDFLTFLANRLVVKSVFRNYIVANSCQWAAM